jgi:hypothetical protein
MMRRLFNTVAYPQVKAALDVGQVPAEGRKELEAGSGEITQGTC